MENLIKILTEQEVKQLILETREYLKNSKACDGTDIIILDILDVSET